MKKLTAAQRRLLARFDSKGFFIVEDFRTSNCPGTQVQDSEGRNHFKFGPGDARAWKSLVGMGLVVMVERLSSADRGLVNRALYLAEVVS